MFYLYINIYIYINELLRKCVEFQLVIQEIYNNDFKQCVTVKTTSVCHFQGLTCMTLCAEYAAPWPATGSILVLALSRRGWVTW